MGLLFRRRIPTSKMKIMQYWDQHEPPEEVEKLMDAWRDAGDLDYVRFNRVSALEFIGRHYDERTLKCFEILNIPAMQSDLFRLLFLYVHGGIYVDADLRRKESVWPLVSLTKGALVFKRYRNEEIKFPNSFLIFRYKRHPIVQQLMETGLQNIEARMDGSAWSVTGPKLLIDLFSALTHDRSALLKDLVIINEKHLAQYLSFEQPAYKRTAVHWIGRTDNYTD